MGQKVGKKMGLTEAEKLAIGENVLVMYGQERILLKKGSLDVDELAGILELLLEEAKAANAVQESLKRQLIASTKVATAKLQKAYITASGMLDMAIAAVDKTSDAAKNFRRLRSRVRMPDQAEEARPLPEPVPGAK